MNIRVVITTIRTQMLFTGRAWHNDRKDQIIRRPLVVLVRGGDLHRQRRALRIDEDVDFAPPFGPICWILACVCPSQWRGTRLTVDRLPLPGNAPFASIETHQCREELLPDALRLPCLETLVQDTTGDSEPVAMHGFPLTACPQNVPDAIHHGAIVGSWSPRPPLFGGLRQMLLHTAPQGTWDAKVIHVCRFCARLLSHGVTSLCLVLGDASYSRLRHFHNLSPIFG